MEIIQTVEYRNRMIIEIEKIMINTCLVTSIPVEDYALFQDQRKSDIFLLYLILMYLWCVLIAVMTNVV